MQRNRRILAAIVCAASSLTIASNSANAACATLPGAWYFFDMEAQSPSINPVYTSVVTGPNLTNKVTLETFKFNNTNQGFDNHTAHVIRCDLSIQANGTFTAPCYSYGPEGAHTSTASGTLALNSSCNLSGTVTVAGDSIPVTIQAGHLNGNVGAGIATQGGRVHSFTVIAK